MKRIQFILAAACTVVIGCGEVDNGAKDFARAEAAAAQHNYTDAQTHFKNGLTKCPTNLTALVGLANVSITLGELPTAQDAISRALEQDESSAELQLIAAQVAYLQKDYAAAAKIYDEVAAAKDLPAALRADALAARAVVELADSTDCDRARIFLWRAQRLYFKCAIAWYHLGILARDNFGYNDVALECLQTFARLDTADKDKVNEVQQTAIRVLMDAITKSRAERPGVATRNPGAAASALTKADKLAKAKKPNAAAVRAALAEAFAADPLSGPAALRYAQQMVKDNAAKTPADVSKVLDAFAAAINANPVKSANYIAAARFAIQHQKYAVAVRLLDRAVSHFPDNKELMDYYIAALRRAGHPAKAKLYMEWRKELN